MLSGIKLPGNHRRLCSSPAGVASQCRADPLSLDTAEALQLLRLHGDLATEADLASGALDERDTVGVERLVDGGSAGLGASDGDTLASSSSGSLCDGRLVTLAEPCNNGVLHAELDEVEGKEPDNVLQEC